tara:strand:- start:521 stop:1090 length:570 start_codon:yes stop_codon:yes gene_type:complete
MASELRVDKIIPTGGVGTDTSNLRHGGGVIQIVEGVYSTQQTITTTSSGSPTAIFDCDITPKFSTSKIRVELVMMCSKIPFHTAYVYLFRGSTILRGLDQGGHPGTFACRHGNYTPGAGGSTYQRYAENREYYTFLDNPQTTSTITYNVKGSTTNASYPFYINRSEQASGTSNDLVKCRCSLTLTEISA